MSDFKIIGNPNPVVGVEEFYTVSDTIPSVLPYQNTATVGASSFEHPVKWEVYVLENRRWRKTKENDKTGKKISYTFFQKSLTRNGIRILAKRGEEAARLDIKTHTAQNPKVEDIELLDKSGKKVTKPLSYGQTLKARVHCLNMEKRTVYVTLWEEDLNGKAGRENANPRNIIETRSGAVKNGKADIDFVLKPSIGNIASMGNKTHTYYATTGLKKDKISSNDVDVTDTEIPVTPYKGKTTPKEPDKKNAPVQQPKTETAKPKTSQTPKTAQGKINSVSITDTAGHAIKGVFKEKQIKVWINSTGLMGKEIRLKLYDEDKISDDLLFDEKFTIKSNLYAVVVPLNQIPRSKGGGYIGEGSEFELYAEVEVLQDHTTKKSKVVDVDAQVFKQDTFEICNKVLKFFQWSEDDKKEKGKGTCPNCEKPVTVEELKKIFTQADAVTLKKAADTYTKYMKEFGMDTCWNKAHFFAQAIVESGSELVLHEGESMNYLADDLYLGRWDPEKKKYNIILSYFKTHKDEAYKYGRLEEIKNNKKIVTQKANLEMIANLGYGPNSNKGKELGNTKSTDGWNFRGKGLIQLTGRSAYEFANTYTKKEGADIISNSDLVSKNVSIAVLSSMAFWKWKNIAPIANGNKDTKNVCKKVGKNVTLANGKTNHDEKQVAFKNSTSVIFNVKDCKYGKVQNDPIPGKAPWMPFALKEIGQKAILGSENNSRITEYFNASTNGKGLNEGTNWCGAFASWCFTQAGYTPPALSCRAAMWQFWKQDKPIYGSAAVIDWNDNQLAKENGKNGAVGGDGHITFVVGISEDGKHYYCVGGNQGGAKGARTVKISKYSKKDIDWFVIPPNYTPTNEEYKLKVMNSEADLDTASSTRT